MVAALYDELDDGERRELENRIAEDETLHRDWQELIQARESLELLLRETTPDDGLTSFEIPQAVGRSLSNVVSLRHWVLAAGIGFAAAATVFLGLLLGGLRIDRTPAGLLVRFGASSPESLAAAIDETSRLAAGDRYVGRAEFAALAQALLEETTFRIDELERRQQSAQIQLTRSLYEALASRQQRQYTDLANQIQLAAIRAASGSRYGTAAPGQQPWERSMEGKHNGTD
jgi:anti-sigma factor RsiW